MCIAGKTKTADVEIHFLIIHKHYVVLPVIPFVIEIQPSLLHPSVTLAYSRFTYPKLEPHSVIFFRFNNI